MKTAISRDFQISIGVPLTLKCLGGKAAGEEGGGLGVNLTPTPVVF